MSEELTIVISFYDWWTFLYILITAIFGFYLGVGYGELK